MVSNIPWIILGDFNVTRFTNKVVGGVQGIYSAMNEFDLFLNNANLVDLVLTGVQLTWCNKRDNGSIAKKLDRVIVRRVPFKFFNFLADRENFLSIVHDAWHSSVRDVTIKAKETKHVLDCCQRDLDANKARVQWLKSGDRNSSYLFKVMTKRTSINNIVSISRSDGTIAKSDCDIKNEATTFFKSLLGQSIEGNHHRLQVLNNLIKNPLSCEMVNPLCCEVTRDEIKDVCFSMNPNKAPGPDGFNGMFF
ncbi:uncharacterized protein [Malus domestica]|uniref:uncharacterized protein n=1 Tax=Malus domestica TaxID=3750 RepID=UPI0039760835